MLEEMFFSEYIFGDETSWKIAGILYWLWVMVGYLYRHIDERRGGVLEMLLGGYGGVTSDSHPAWNRIQAHQKCPPLCREIVRTLAMEPGTRSSRGRQDPQE